MPHKKPAIAIMIAVKPSKKDDKKKYAGDAMPNAMNKAWETLKGLPEQQLFVPRSNYNKRQNLDGSIPSYLEPTNTQTVHPSISGMLGRMGTRQAGSVEHPNLRVADRRRGGMIEAVSPRYPSPNLSGEGRLGETRGDEPEEPPSGTSQSILDYMNEIVPDLPLLHNSIVRPVAENDEEGKDNPLSDDFGGGSYAREAQAADKRRQVMYARNKKHAEKFGMRAPGPQWGTGNRWPRRNPFDHSEEKGRWLEPKAQRDEPKGD